MDMFQMLGIMGMYQWKQVLQCTGITMQTVFTNSSANASELYEIPIGTNKVLNASFYSH